MDHDGMGGRGVENGRRRYEEDEEHHSIYIGVPVPRSYRRKRRRRRSDSSRETGDGDRERGHESHRHQRQDRDDRRRFDMDDGVLDPEEQSLDPNSTVSPAAERLRYILSDEDDVPTPTIFTEMDILQHEGDELEWKESARWVKFEEKVEEGGERWSKPHVSTLSLHSLFELRTCLQTGTILLLT
ncbi:hypothetical protein COCON_G00168560 [Conger conger]|uniref:Band 3 cytoplasmic domain-containing protein n=1 Tax=Conger conger TaxID=82655 RepID=A0A9Q1D7J2_CONCO|nr:hypothetical protein COCON_G00168560 [Conger conger]